LAPGLGAFSQHLSIYPLANCKCQSGQCQDPADKTKPTVSELRRQLSAAECRGLGIGIGSGFGFGFGIGMGCLELQTGQKAGEPG